MFIIIVAPCWPGATIMMNIALTYWSGQLEYMFILKKITGGALVVTSLRLTWIDVLTVASHIWSICISCLLQDDIYKAGGGCGQRLWLCCF